MGTEQKNSICDSCANCNCSFQTGIYRETCDFYIPVKELGYAVVGIEHLRKYRQLQNDYEARLKADKIAMLDKIKEDFITRYPRNYAGELELGGRSCVFSLNDILHAIDKYKTESEVEE